MQMLKTIEYDKDNIYTPKNESVVWIDTSMFSEEIGHIWSKDAYALNGISMNQEINSKWVNKVSSHQFKTVFSIDREEDKFVKKKKSLGTFLSNELLEITDASLSNDLKKLISNAQIDTSKIKILRNCLSEQMQVVLDVNLFKTMLSNFMAIQDATDEYMINLAFQRKDHQADISLAKVIEELELDVGEIFSLVDSIEED